MPNGIHRTLLQNNPHKSKIRLNIPQYNEHRKQLLNARSSLKNNPRSPTELYYYKMIEVRFYAHSTQK